MTTNLATRPVSICIGYVRIGTAPTWAGAMTALRTDILDSYPRLTLIQSHATLARDDELAAISRGPDDYGYLVTSRPGGWMDSQRYARAGEHGLTAGDLAIVHDFSNGNRYEWTIDVKCKILSVDGPAHKAVVRITQHDSAQFERGQVVTLPVSFLRPRPRKPVPAPAGQWEPRIPDGTRITAEEFTPLTGAEELEENERADFGYLDWDAIDRGEDSATFLRRQGELYDLSSFEAASGELAARGWHGACADSAFSAVLVRIIDDETVQTGLLLS